MGRRRNFSPGEEYAYNSKNSLERLILSLKKQTKNKKPNKQSNHLKNEYLRLTDQ